MFSDGSVWTDENLRTLQTMLATEFLGGGTFFENAPLSGERWREEPSSMAPRPLEQLTEAGFSPAGISSDFQRSSPKA
jgi:hypothetical protein